MGILVVPDSYKVVGLTFVDHKMQQKAVLRL